MASVGLLAFCVVLCCAAGLGEAWKVPMRAQDVLPMLPHGIAWPVMNTVNNAVNLLPQFVGAVASDSDTVKWEGACFQQNEAYMEYKETGAVLHIQTGEAHSWTCMDLYVFATPYRVTWDYYFTARKHTLNIDNWQEGELDYVKAKGFSVFLMPAGMLGTLAALWDVVPLFSNSAFGESANIAFLTKHMGATFVKRAEPRIPDFSPDDIKSGDFLALSKLRGRWGAFETLEKWVSGAYAGHTAVCLRDADGKLWVGESGHENEAGEEVIAVISWEEWWDLQLKDTANAHVALLPLHPDVRARFNETAAWEYVRKMDGQPYGYHNMIFSWIDTERDNYPPPLDANLVASVITMWTRIQPEYAANIWNEALNKRLGTEGLDLPSVLWETEQRGIPFGQLLAIPEKDEWEYSDGKSTTCVAFILAMYKAAGVFGSLGDKIQVTEFTIRDAYMLRIFEDDTTRLPSWCHEADGSSLGYCQLLGEYRMDLPEYNSLDFYSHMNEHCPSLPPNYERLTNC